MVKNRILALIVTMLVFSLSGCSRSPEPVSSPDETLTRATIPVTEPAQTIPPATIALETVPPATRPPETEPTRPPCELYIPGIGTEEVIQYFSEVCLQAEYYETGNPTRLQKWVRPICYTLQGYYTETDYAVLQNFVNELNEMEGFPGMYEISDHNTANLTIYFCSQYKLIELMGEDFQGMDGAVTFWYTNDEIDNAIICYRTDLDQQLRNSVILEEVYNGLGPIQDTALRPDSIIWSEFSQPQELTELDWLILKLLYHPDMKCGMDEWECASVIRDLYYENP